MSMVASAELGDRSAAIEDLQQSLEIYRRLELTCTPGYEKVVRDLNRLNSR